MKWSNSNQAFMNVRNINLNDWFLEGISRSYKTSFRKEGKYFINLGFKSFKLL